MKRAAEALDQHRLQYREGHVARYLLPALRVDLVARLAGPPRRVDQLVWLQLIRDGDQPADRDVPGPHPTVGHQAQGAAGFERLALFDRRGVERDLSQG